MPKTASKAKTEKTERPKPSGPKMAMCRVEASVLSVDHGYGRALGKGLVVDLTEKVSDDVYLSDLVKSSWFEPISTDEAKRLREKTKIANGMDSKES